MIDVHRTILPLEARRRPDAVAMVADSIPVESGLRILAPADMVAHAAAHLIADGDLAGGLRNHWDRDQMLRDFGRDEAFWPTLQARAARHQLLTPVRRAVRLAHDLYGTPVPPAWRKKRPADRFSAAACSHATAGGGRPASPCASLSTSVRTGCECPLRTAKRRGPI